MELGLQQWASQIESPSLEILDSGYSSRSISESLSGIPSDGQVGETGSLEIRTGTSHGRRGDQVEWELPFSLVYHED